MEEKPKWSLDNDKLASNLETETDNKENENKKKKFKVGERYVLKSMLPIGTFYKTYKGIDVGSKKFVTVYLKPSAREKVFARNVKEELKQKITPPLKWSGTEKIDKNVFDIEVYARFGPSLEEVMHKYKQKVTEKTFYLLSYHLLKLLDKLDSAGYVSRTLSLKTIILGESSHRKDLFLINTFDLQRKNQEFYNNYDTKYCSIGCHLKLRTCSKDTLESMCYVLMDFYLRGRLFDSNIQKQKDILERKNSLNTEGIPMVFLEFYEYVKNLSHLDEIRFTQWKIKFKRCIPETDFLRPYQWVSPSEQQQSPKDENSQSIQSSSYQNNDPITPLDFLFSKKRSSVSKFKLLQQIETDNLVYEEDQNQILEGESGFYSEIKDKFMETDFFKGRRAH